MKSLLSKKNAPANQKRLSVEAFKMKAQTEKESLDNIISGLMGNCHDDPGGFISSSFSPVICDCPME